MRLPARLHLLIPFAVSHLPTVGHTGADVDAIGRCSISEHAGGPLSRTGDFPNKIVCRAR